MAATTTPSAFAVTYVVPSVEGDSVVCECGAQMRLVNYVSYPGGKRWIFYKCVQQDTHITAALPLAGKREG